MQRASLGPAGCRHVYKEGVSAVQWDRPEPIGLLNALRDKDVIMVTHLDRIARSTRGLLNVAEQIEVTGAGLCSLAAPWADTTSPAGRMVLIVFSGSTTFEHCLMLSRASAATQRLDEEDTSARETAKLLQVHAATVYRAYDLALLSEASEHRTARSGATAQPLAQS